MVSTASAVNRVETSKFYEGGVLDNEMSFGFKVCNNEHLAAIEDGTINPSFMVVRDTLPPNATFISTDEGIYDPGSHSIVWTFPDTLKLGKCWWPQVLVQFSSADYSIGDTETNTGYISYTPIGEIPITVEEIEDLMDYGITRIYSPDDGRSLGLQGMINDMVEKSDFPVPSLVLPKGKEIIESLF